jgi:hypothetical protein
LESVNRHGNLDKGGGSMYTGVAVALGTAIGAQLA